MEKGYFHFNLGHEDFEPLTTEQLEQYVAQVPLPNQVPKKQDLSALPKDLLRSSTIESLIEQNEDLMSRLAVNLRKSARLESLVQASESREAELKQTLENLKDQLLVFRQKETLFDTRSFDLQDKVDTLEDKLAFQTYALEQKDLLFDKLQEELNQTQRKQHRLVQYRRRLKRFIPEYKARVRKDFKLLSAENERLTLLLERDTEMRKALQFRMDDMLQHFQSSKRETEQTLESLREANNRVSQENLTLLAEAKHTHKLEEQIIDLENKILAQERAFEERQSEFHDEINGLQRELGLFRQDCKNKVLQLENQATLLEERRKELDFAKTELSRSTEQVEALQSLWNDSQNKIEKLEAQVASLQKLNQHLSIELQSKRQNVFRDQDQEILSEITGENKPGPSETIAPVEASRSTDDVFARIDGLLTEIQSGYSQNRD